MSKPPPPVPLPVASADRDNYRRTKAKAASLLFPGLGQLVLKRRALGALLLILALIVLAIIFIMLFSLFRFLCMAFQKGGDYTFAERFIPVFKLLAGIPVLLALYIWGFIDVLRAGKKEGGK